MSYTTTLLDQWTEACRSLFPRQKENVATHPIHACVIGGEYHFVHAPKLAQEDPSYFSRLERHAHKSGAKLLADRRLVTKNQRDCRRNTLMPIMFLALGISGEYSYAKPVEDLIDGLPTPAPQIALAPENRSGLEAHNATSEKLKSILLNHFMADGSPTDQIEADIDGLALYYASHPEAAELLMELSQEAWTLKYAPHTFQTSVKGSRMSVDEVIVYFDPRSGAQLQFYDKCDDKKPFCVASPADALLHELLHAYSMLKHSRQFIAQGGLSAHMYPHEHERNTILRENTLYKAMSRRDSQPRPIRREHTGRHILVSCVTCIE